MLFSKKPRHWREKAERRIRVGEQIVHFNRETRWIGNWLDAVLTPKDNKHRCINRARQAEARQRRIVILYGVPPVSARSLQQSIVQGTLQASELTWNGQVGMGGEYQAAISCMGQATLGAFQSTPLGTVAAESSLTLARPLLDHRQARFAQRLMDRPQEQRPELQGHEANLSRRNSGLTARFRASTFLGTGERAEEQQCGSFRTVSGRVIKEEKRRRFGRLGDGRGGGRPSGLMDRGWMMGEWGQRRCGGRMDTHRRLG